MDIRVYINNDPIFQALKVGLDREEKLLNSIGLQTQRAATRRATDEVVHLNQRVSDLQRVSAECVAAQNKAAAATDPNSIPSPIPISPIPIPSPSPGPGPSPGPSLGPRPWP